MRDPELGHGPKATLRPVSDHEERFWPTRMRWRLRGAWMWPSFVVAHAARRPAAPPPLAGARGHRPDPGHPAGHVRQPDPDRRRRPLAGAPDVEAPRRRPTRARPPKAQLEVLTDRIGTGLLVAGVFGILAAGLANRPHDRRRDQPARARPPRLLEDYVDGHGDDELRRNLEASDTRAPTPTATTAAASRTTTAQRCDLLLHRRPQEADEARPRPEPAAQQARALAASQLGQARPSGRTSSSSTVVAPAPQRGLGHEQREELGARGRRRWKLRPTASDAPVDRHRQVAHRARAALPGRRPVTRVGRICVERLDVGEQPALAIVPWTRVPAATRRRHARRPISSGCGPIR